MTTEPPSSGRTGSGSPRRSACSGKRSRWPWTRQRGDPLSLPGLAERFERQTADRCQRSRPSMMIHSGPGATGSRNGAAREATPWTPRTRCPDGSSWWPVHVLLRGSLEEFFTVARGFRMPPSASSGDSASRRCRRSEVNGGYRTAGEEGGAADGETGRCEADHDIGVCLGRMYAADLAARRSSSACTCRSVQPRFARSLASIAPMLSASRRYGSLIITSTPALRTAVAATVPAIPPPAINAVVNGHRRVSG